MPFGVNAVFAAATGALGVRLDPYLGCNFLVEIEGLLAGGFREVRGLGLMVGIELKQKVTPYLQALMAHGVLALPAGLTVMRFLPPLVIEKSDLEKVVAAVRLVLEEQ